MRIATLVILGLVGTAHANPCPATGAVIVVETANHDLVLCDGGTATAHHAVALGEGGVGKQKEGDKKTPLGTYAIAAPKASALYGTFIAIAFPTAEQKKQGLTGSDLGIHGPPRESKREQRADWTRGCIAVGDDKTMGSVAAWVQSKKVTLLEIR